MKKISKKNLKYISFISILLLIILVIIILLSVTPTEKELQEGLKNCGEGTVIYKNNNYCWQKSIKPERSKNWEDAKNYCENLVLGEKNDWRLPTLNELSGISELNISGISINEKIFTDTEKTYYWTSTKHTIKDSHWYVHFDKGYVGWSLDLRSNFGVRCIRDNNLLN